MLYSVVTVYPTLLSTHTLGMLLFVFIVKFLPMFLGFASKTKPAFVHCRLFDQTCPKDNKIPAATQGNVKCLFQLPSACIESLTTGIAMRIRGSF